MTNQKMTHPRLMFFKQLIQEKIEEAEKNLKLQREAYSNANGNGTGDTAPQFKAFDEGSKVANQETASHLATRQEKFLRDLKNALIRIENKTYGVCAITGKLIPEERLVLVPHATRSIEAKHLT